MNKDNNREQGKLFVCGTPIGNIKDITIRCLEVLEQADVIACEDTRQTLKLLNHYGIKKKLISYHEHNKNAAGEKIINLLADGKNIALVTDAGMPCISDPGTELVNLARENFIDIEVIPGPTAFITALALSGMYSRRFVFEGFIDKKNDKKDEFIKRVQNEERTIIIYESPHDLIETLGFIGQNLGDRKICVVKELTKIHEEVIFGLASEIIDKLNRNEPKGEYVILIEGAENKLDFEQLTIDEHVNIYLNAGYDLNSAIKKVAKERGVHKNEIYSFVHKNKDNN